MTATLTYNNSRLVLSAHESYLEPRHKSQLRFYGFTFNAEERVFIMPTDDPLEYIIKVKNL